MALGTGADATVADGACYRYRVSAADAVGNRTTSPPSEAARVDTTRPSAPALELRESSPAVHVSGAVVFFRPASEGSLTVAAASEDPQSGIARVAFPALAGAGGGGEDASPPYETSYGWSALGARGTQTVTATNRAGLGASTSFALVADETAPTGVSVTAAVSGSGVALTIDEGTDAGSGVDAGSLVVERDAASLGGGSCGSFSDAWTAVTPTAGKDTTAAAGACYRYRVRVADNVGNVAVSAPSAAVVLDTTDPSTPALTLTASSGAYVSGTTVFYRLAGGSFTVAATSSDAESGIAEVVFPTLAGASGGGGDAIAPYEASYSWTALAVPWPTSAAVTATNGAERSAAAAFTLTSDDTAPSVHLDRDGASGNLQVVADDTGSGVGPTLPLFQRAAASPGVGCDTPLTWENVTPEPLGSNNYKDTTAEGGVAYCYRATVSDNVGNTGQGTTATAG